MKSIFFFAESGFLIPEDFIYFRNKIDENPTNFLACADQSQACSGISELCDQESYRSTLETYCKKTCGFCTASDEPAADKKPSGGSKECKNEYPNCDTMQFLCTDKNDDFNQR